MDEASTTDFDVIVVGTGIAGLSAAAAAVEGGGKVAIMERTGKEDRGGNTRWTESLLRVKNLEEVSDDFYDHFSANAGYHLDPALVAETVRDRSDWPQIVKSLAFTDPEIIATFADGVGPTLSWLVGFGIKFDYLPTYFLTATQPRMSPVGGGQAMVEALATWLERNGATFFYETTATRLVQRDDGVIEGLAFTDRLGQRGIVHGASVVLASGGFEGNPEMLARYVGPSSRFVRPVAQGGYLNKGEGVRMALDIGAAPCGDFTRFHAEPIDPRSGVSEPIILAFNYGLIVDRDAKRFVDEGARKADDSYEDISRQILERPDGIAYLILDSRIDDVPNWRKSIRTDQPAIQADTITDLAVAIGLNPAAVDGLVKAYNAACPQDDAGFKPLEADGLSTAEGLQPPKSNWARPLDRAPFLAYPMICGCCFTFGGLKTNAEAEVLDADGSPIHGLYTAGEAMGLYYGRYPGGTSVLRGAVFGRIAGARAAARSATLKASVPAT